MKNAVGNIIVSNETNFSLYPKEQSIFCTPNENGACKISINIFGTNDSDNVTSRLGYISGVYFLR